MYLIEYISNFCYLILAELLNHKINNSLNMTFKKKIDKIIATPANRIILILDIKLLHIEAEFNENPCRLPSKLPNY